MLKKILSFFTILVIGFSLTTQIVIASNKQVTRVEVENLFSAPVVKQINNNPTYVSPSFYVLTQFGLAEQNGTIGLLAHNWALGHTFTNLKPGNLVSVYFNNGTIGTYTIMEIRRFQALTPTSPDSNFIDLDTNLSMTSVQVFNQIYTGGDKVVFQTCIYKEGNWSWGRLFIIAIPAIK